MQQLILWQIYVANNNNTYFGLHVKCPVLLSNFNQIWIFSTYFHTRPQYPFPKNPSSAHRTDTCRPRNWQTWQSYTETDRQTWQSYYALFIHMQTCTNAFLLIDCRGVKVSWTDSALRHSVMNTDQRWGILVKLQSLFYNKLPKVGSDADGLISWLMHWCSANHSGSQSTAVTIGQPTTFKTNFPYSSICNNSEGRKLGAKIYITVHKHFWICEPQKTLLKVILFIV